MRNKQQKHLILQEEEGIVQTLFQHQLDNMKYVKLAQMPPMDPMAGMGMPAAPMAMPAAPPASSQKQIKIPLSNLGLILADAGIELKIMEQLEDGGQDIANKIWLQYGGGIKGGIVPGRVGEREDKKEVDQTEIENTDETRWKRLPEGETLQSLGITLQNVVDAVKSISFGMSKEKIKGPAGGGGPMAFSKDKLVRTADHLDSLGFYSLADKLM